MKQRTSPDPLTLDRARDLRAAQTELEALFWRRVRNRQLGGWKFRRQHPFGPFILDFYVEDARLAVELDGGQHGEDEGVVRDTARTAYLAAHGIRVLRFWNGEIQTNLIGVLNTVLHELEGAARDG